MLGTGIIMKRMRKRKCAMHNARVTAACKTPSHTQSKAFWLNEMNRGITVLCNMMFDVFFNLINKMKWNEIYSPKFHKITNLNNSTFHQYCWQDHPIQNQNQDQDHTLPRLRPRPRLNSPISRPSPASPKPRPRYVWKEKQETKQFDLFLKWNFG